MWRFILLGVVAVVADDRWSRQSTERRQGDWIPVAAPSVSFHKGRSVDQNVAASSGLPSVLTPPIQQQHPRLLPPPPPDGLFQQAATSGFLNNFPGQQSLLDTKPRQFLPQQNINNPQTPFRFKEHPPLTDSAGIPSNLFQVGPQQFTQNPTQQNSQLISTPPFLPPQFIPPPQRTPLQPFVQFNQPQLLPQNLQFPPEFQLQADQPTFLTQPGLPPQQQVLFNQLAPSIGQSPGRFSQNITNDFKQEQQNQGKEEVQLLYVPVETLRQRGHTFPNNRGNKKVEPSNSNQNGFVNLNTQQGPKLPVQTAKPFFRLNENDQFFKQNQDLVSFQNDNPQLHHVIQETTAPQIQFKQTSFPQALQEQTTYTQDIRNQQSETVTPSSTTSNPNKYRLDQKQRDEFPSLADQQFALDQFHRQLNQESVTPGKQSNSNQGYYQNQQFSNTFNSNNDEAFHRSTSPEEHQTVPPPHQPPLSVYMETNANSKIADVLTHLKSAKTIPVLDTIGPDSPQVFVGPSNLNPPSGYLKFELPYLSSLDNNRVERKVDKLPFFVAPLNFQPPPGYSKIPFPAPHIGSVVVSNITILKTALHDKPEEYLTKPETSTPSSIQQYSVASDLTPFSPQLPSLVNSLQDERYFPSSVSGTTDIPTVTAAQTTPVYTTPYRRTPGRGSHRVHTTTEDTPTRRPITRQRRPQNGRPNSYRASQIVTTTTPEPVVATTVQQYDQSNEQQNTYSDITTTPPQVHNSQNVREPLYDTSNQNNEQYSQTYQQQQPQDNQQIYKQNQNDERYSQTYQQQPHDNYNVLQSQGVVPQLEQVQQYFTQVQQQQYLQGNQQAQKETEQQTNQQYQHTNYNSDNVTPQNSYPDQYSSNYSPSGSGSVSDVPQQQTTEAEIQRVSPQTSERTTANNRPNSVRRDPLRQRFRGRNSYQTTTEHVTTTEQQKSPQRIKTRPSHTQNLQIVKETNSNYPDNYPTNTERLDDQSTERNEEINYNNYNDFRQLNTNNQQQNYQNGPLTINDNVQYYQQQQYNVQQQHETNNNPNKAEHFNSEENISSQLENTTPHFTEQRETTQISNTNLHNTQQVFADTSVKYEDNSHLTERPINQQRLTKYTRVRGRINQGQQREQSNEQNVPQYNHQEIPEKQQPEQQSSYESLAPSLENTEVSSITESEPEQITTTPKPAVRVRGRVRNRQRTSSARQTTTTEPPNYPAESGLSNTESHYVRRPVSHRKTPSDRTSNYNRNSANRFRNSNTQTHYNSNSNENVENDPLNNPSSTTSISQESSSTTTDTVPVSRKYNHILNRNTVRRPNNNRYVHQTTVTAATTESTRLSDGDTTKYLIRTTRRPGTQTTKLQDGRARIRRPTKAALTTTTTEQTSLNSGENFAPSAASNEILDPYNPTQTNYNNHNLQYNTPNRNPTKQYTPSYESSTILTPTPFAPANSPSNVDDYWNQGFTIQQSNSYDFSAESSPATQSTLSTHYNEEEYDADDEEVNHSYRSKPVWKNPTQSTHSHDQTPYSSNEQYVAAVQNTKSKSKQSTFGAEGKENQWNEKTQDYQDHENQEQPSEIQFDSESFNKQYDYDGQYKKETQPPQEEPIEERRPVYVQTEERPEETKDNSDNSETSSPNESQLAFTDPEDIIRTKDGFIQRKAVDPVTGKKSGRRRGAWVRVRVHKKPKDVFETAESQNLASLSNNAIKSSEGKPSIIIQEYSIPPNHRPTDPYSTEIPQTTVSQTTEQTTTPQAEENLQKSLTDMIREIIKEEENEEEEESKHSKDAILNNTITTTIPTFAPEEVTESQQVTTTIVNDGIAITVIPETVTQPISVEAEEVTTIKEEQHENENTTSEPRVLGTSTTTEISLETEICYRGRCVKSKKNKKPIKHILAASADSESDLMPVE